MEVGAGRRGNLNIVAVTGRIDHLNAAAFHDRIAPHLGQCRAGGDRIVFDLAGLDYVSSAGLRIFMIAAKQARAQGGRIAVVNMRPLVQEIFEISHFHLVYEIFATLDAATAALGETEPAAT